MLSRTDKFIGFIKVIGFIELKFKELNRPSKLNNSIVFLFTIVIFLFISTQAFAVLDSYLEDFNSRTPDVTIDGQDYWSVTQGGINNAIVDDNVTPTGTGRSLRISDVSPSIIAGRPYDYGGVSPTWVSFLVKASSGSRQRVAPSGGIAAVTFDYTKKILATNGSTWVDTGMTYDTDKWYEVILDLDFTARTYDLYISPVAVPRIDFTPVKSGLQFIDTSISRLSRLNFYGPYSAAGTANSYVDDISVNYIYRLEFVTAAQMLTQNQPSNPITVELQNYYAETQTAVKDYTLDLKSTSATGKFSLTKEPWIDVTQIVLPKYSQSVTFYYKDSTSGSPVISVSKYPEAGWLEALQQQRVIQRLAHFDVSATTPQIAGQLFTLTITAKDDEGNVDADYCGTVDLAAEYVSPSTGTKQLSIDNATGFLQGLLEIPISYPDAGTITITVKDRDEADKVGSSGSILFLPESFALTAETPQYVNKSFDLTVEAVNTDGEITPNYSSNVKLSPVFVTPDAVDNAALSPAVLAAEDFIKGKAEAEVSYNRWGAIKIKAQDEANPSRLGESSDIRFVPSSLKVTVASPPSGRDFYYVSEVFAVDISINDAAEQPIPNFIGNIIITAAPNLDVPSEYDFVLADSGKHTFSVSSSSTGTFTIKAQEAADNLSAESQNIVIKNATVQVIDTTAPLGTTAEVVIQLVDEEGNIITTESDLEIYVKLQEGLDNATASCMSTVVPVRFVNGQIKIFVSDSEAEEVAIIPQTKLGLKIRRGKVTFGRIAKSGIGTLMWRELKEEEKKK